MPRAHDADLSDLCSNKDCPLWSKSCAPVHSISVPSPQAIVVCEHPGPKEKYWREPLRGYAGRRVRQALHSVGLDRVSVCNRIACFPPPHKSTDSVKTQAAKCCRARFDRDMERLTAGGTVPILLLGKHAGDGWLPRVRWVLRSGAAKSIPLQKLARGMVYDGHCYLDNPSLAFWHKAPMQEVWLSGLRRFADHVHGVTHPPPTQPIVDVSDDALAALRAMGGAIGWDVETLGIDPLTAPITCIGISDGVRTVSVPWDSYTTAKQGEVIGVAEAKRSLPSAIRNEVIALLNSNRTHVTQNGSYDVLACGAKGLPGRNDFDIMHAHKICWPEIPAGLEEVAVHLVPSLPYRWKSVFRTEIEGVSKGMDAFADSAAIDLRDYNGMDAWATVSAMAPLQRELARED